MERNGNLETLIYKVRMISTKKNLWLLPDEICIVRGSAEAKNLMFENKKDHKTFLKLWDKYLGGMVDVINYHLSPTDWTILFRAKSSEAIECAYTLQRKKSRKALRKCTLKCPKRMLSEHIRIFLSQFVRSTNHIKGRKGTKVLERFHKYIVKSDADYQKIFKIISNQVRMVVHKNPRYQADESDYDIRKEINEKGVLRVGRLSYLEMSEVLGCVRFKDLISSVLRNFDRTLINSQLPPNPT